MADQVVEVGTACECSTVAPVAVVPDPCRPRVAFVVDALARALRDCLCEALADTVAGPVCRCSFMSGVSAIADICGVAPDGSEGQAWVRMSRLFLTRDFPRPISDIFNCAAGLWAVEFELGVLRCGVVPDEDGDPPSAEELNCEAAKVMDDAYVLRTTAECCIPSHYPTVPGEWQPLSSGGCIGGKVTVMVLLVPGPISVTP